jgi:hypothetical protein
MSDKPDEIEVTPEMIEAGVRVLNASSAIEHPIGVDEALVADIYRAMEAAKRSDPATVRSW